MDINRIYNEDCYEGIKRIPDKSVDCIYTDVPYLINNHSGGKSEIGKRTAKRKAELSYIDKGIDILTLNEYIRVMKKINIFIWCSKLQMFDIMKFFNNISCFFEMLVWIKNNPMPIGNNRWLPDLEYCLYFRENGVILNDGYDLKAKWYKSAINKLDKDKFDHPTIKPLPLVERHLLHATQPGDVVLDPFIGSGTTAVACKNTGRNYIGFEIDKKWYDIANNRLNNVDARGQISFVNF